MRLLFSFFILLATLANAQNQRFYYEYKFIPDSTNVEEVKTEIMNLDTSEKGSKFYSYEVFRSDSIMKVDLEKQLQATGSINIKTDMRKGNVRYSVSKTYPDFKVQLNTKLLRDSYNVNDNRKIIWKILPEKQKIGEWNAQKAEANFAGRTWTVWFTTDIPLQEGPYKFHGLPGLIVKAEDKTGSHKFELKGIKKIQNQIENLDVFAMKGVEISQNQYQKILKDYENDPTKGLKEMMVGGTSIMLTGNGGDNAKFMKEREKQMKETIKKNNNKIELSFQ